MVAEVGHDIVHNINQQWNHFLLLVTIEYHVQQMSQYLIYAVRMIISRTNCSAALSLAQESDSNKLLLYITNLFYFGTSRHWRTTYIHRIKILHIKYMNSRNLNYNDTIPRINKSKIASSETVTVRQDFNSTERGRWLMISNVHQSDLLHYY